MPVCSVIGCGKTPNQPSLTIHRIPRNERRKKKWLEAIGIEYIKPNVKDIYICSLHFDDTCFNKTLNVTRLRDDAVPVKFVRLPLKTGRAVNPALASISATSGAATSALPLKTCRAVNPALASISATSGAATSALPLKTGRAVNPALASISATSGAATSALPMTTAECTSFASVPGTSGVDNIPNEAQKIKKLEDKCDFLRRKVKTLNEKVRRQKKRIAKFQNIIKDLRKRNLVNNKNSRGERILRVFVQREHSYSIVKRCK